MSIYSHDLETDLGRNNSLLYLENYVDFDCNLTESEMQPYLDELQGIVSEKVDMDDGFGGKLRPVFIVLLYSDSNFDHVAEKFVKNQKYWHAAIGFGPSLSRTYSFNFGEANANKIKGGLSFESMQFYKDEHPTGTMEVSCIFLSPYKYKKLKATLDYYLRNKEKTRYSFVNLLYSLFGKAKKNGLKMNLVCSTFVDTILRSVDVNISGIKHTNLVKPDDLRKRENEKQFKVFEGMIKDYDPKKVQEKVSKLSDDVNNDYFKKNVAESVQNIFPLNDSSNLDKEKITELDESIDLSLIQEMQSLGVSIFDDIDTLDEGVIENIKKHFTNLSDLKRQWKKFADTFVNHEWIFRYINPKQYQMVQKYYNIITDDNVEYGAYKRAFKFFCNFMGLPSNKVILENIVIIENKKDPERNKISVKYSKGLVKVNIPDDIHLVHVSPVKGITQLIPTFRSKVKGKYMYPSKRVFFTVKGEIKKNQAGLEGQQINSYITKQHFDHAYIDPTYSKFKNGCVYIETDTPIQVTNNLNRGFKKFLAKEDVEIGLSERSDLDMFIEDEPVSEGIIDIAKHSFNNDWKTSDQGSAIKVFKSDNLTEEEYNDMLETVRILRRCETYQEYKPAFNKFCKFCHIVPDGTIIRKIDIKSGSVKDKNYMYVEYAYNTKKIKLKENQSLYHVTKVSGISSLEPHFRGKSEKGYLYDKPRIYFSIYEKMPKGLADYNGNEKMHYYKCNKEITEVYVDPLLRNSAIGAVYVSTNSKIPVTEITK